MAKFGFSTTGTQAAAAFSEHIKGKTVLITGPAPGNIGEAFLLAIALHEPKLLILAGRNKANLEPVQEKISKQSPDVSTRILLLDLASQAQIREAAHEVSKYPEKIDVLVNNAGVMATPWLTTKEGIELQFGINHIGHFLFTNLLLKTGRINKGGRIVNISSEAHNMSGVLLNDPNFSDGKTYTKEAGYGQSKTANILYSISLAEKLDPNDVLAYSVNPGGIATGLYKYMSDEFLISLGLKNEQGEFVSNDYLTWKTADQGSATHVVASFDSSIANQNGAYLSDSNIAMDACMDYAKDKENAKKLWDISEKMVGEQFTF